MKLNKLNKIGEGAFSQVWLAEDPDKKKVVIKKYHENCLDNARREFIFLNAVESSQFVSSFGFSEQKREVYLEYVQGVHPDYKNFKSEADFGRFAYWLSFALLQLHTKGICFNDLKPENIILKDNQFPILIDLGLATPVNFNDSLFRGSPAYAAPEKFMNTRNSYATDIFALGMLFLQLKTGILPADKFTEKQYKSYILNENKWNNLINKQIEDPIIRKMLFFSPYKRIALIDILLYFKNKINVGSKLPLAGIINQYLFPEQDHIADLLLKKSNLDYDSIDELPKIIERATLKLETSQKRSYILRESEFLYQPEIFYKKLLPNFKTSNDLIREEEANFIVVRDLQTQKLDLFNQMERKPNTFVLNKVANSNLAYVSKNEYNHLLNILGFDKAQKEESLKTYLPTKPYLVRVEMLNKIADDTTRYDDVSPILDLLSTLKVSIPYFFFAKLFNKRKINKIVSNSLTELSGTSIKFTGTRSKNKLNEELIIDFKKIAELNECWNIALRCDFLLGDFQASLKTTNKYLKFLIKNEYYTTALEIIDDFNQHYSKLTLSLKRKKAFLLRKQGKPEKALDYYRSIKVSSDSIQRAVLLSDMAVIFQEMDDLEQAERLYDDIIPIFKNKDEIKSLLRSHNNLGVIQVEKNDFSAARDTFLNLLENAEINNDKQFITMAHLNLADVYLRKGDWKQSLAQAEIAAEMGAKYKKKTIEVWAQIFGLLAQWALGRFEPLQKAIKSLRDDEKLKENHQLRTNLLIALLPVAQSLDLKLAQSLFDKLPEDYLDGKKAAIETFWFNLKNKNFLNAVKISKNLKNRKIGAIASACLKNEQNLVLENLEKLLTENDIFNFMVCGYNISDYFASNNEKTRKYVNKFAKLHDFAPIKLINSNKTKSKVPENMHILWEVMSIIYGNESFRKTMESVLAGIIRITELERAVYFDFEENEPFPKFGLNRSLDQININEIKISSTVLKETIKLGHIRFFNNLQEDIPFDIKSNIFGMRLRTAVC